MKRLKFSEILIFYDGPELFTAIDQLGGFFLCLLITRDEESDIYLCVRASKGRIDNLIFGEIDLRGAFISSETEEFFRGEAKNGDLDNFIINPIMADQILDNWLPKPDLYLNLKHIRDTGIVSTSRQKQRGILLYELNPPESSIESKISAGNLSQGLYLFQRAVRHSYNSSFQVNKIDNAIVKEMALTPENYELEVVGFSNNSFVVHMQTASPADLVGYSYFSRAMEIIDSVTNEILHPESAIKIISGYSGHFVTAYKDLLKFIIDNNVPISYEWTMPSKMKSEEFTITPRLAKPLYEALVEKIELETVYKSLTGRFTRLDLKNESWRLHSDVESKDYSGLSNVNLDGIVIGTQQYEIICEERLELDRGTGKENPRLFLISFSLK